MNTTTKLKMTGLLLAALFAVPAFAANDLMKDFDSLGGNGELMEKAKALNPDAKVEVVQDRIVNRRHRVELSPELADVVGGDAYNHTREFGLNAHYHFNPHWSVGARYGYATNTLRDEAHNMINNAGIIPQIDYPKSETLAFVDWYPIYGKMNMYDLGVAHFDLYLTGGGGQVQLKSGSTSTYTAGLGLGLWWSQHLTTRAELRYQTYTAKHYDGQQKMDLTVASLQIGYML